VLADDPIFDRWEHRVYHCAADRAQVAPTSRRQGTVRFGSTSYVVWLVYFEGLQSDLPHA
jgi:hypothetical protein